MKLKFQKTENGDIAAYILDDTEQLDFSYTKMIEALMDGQLIECDYSDNMSEEEKVQIESLTSDIYNKIHTDENGNVSMFM